MIIVDTALARRAAEGNPIRVVLSGAGFMGRRMTRQVSVVEGMTVAGVVNRTPEKAVKNLLDAGYADIVETDDPAEAAAAIAGGKPVVTTDPDVLTGAEGVEVVIEATGEMEFGARVAVGAIEAGKHVVLDNAELDATVGPLLKAMADEKGVVISGIDGDEPSVAMNLIRLVRTMGLEPVLVGNIKGFMDPYRNPETQQGFAEQHGQNPYKVASFADGTKLAAEITTLSNASGFRLDRRGMEGPRLDDVSQVLEHWTDAEGLRERPVVDFILGAKPGSGVFVVGYEEDPERRAAMDYLKMGPGPLHLFTRPFHLPHLEGPLTAARAVLFGDAAVTPAGAPITDFVAIAKKDLAAGEVLDGIGGFTCYGIVDDAAAVAAANELPFGLTPGAVMKRAVTKDTPLTWDDVELPADSLVAGLRREQSARFGA